MNVELIAATQKDVSLIGELAKQIWNDHYPEIIGQQQVDFMLQKLYNPESLFDQMEKGQQFHLVFADDSAVGFVAVNEEGEGKYFLNKFYIQTGQKGKGLGATVFFRILNLYPALKEMRLQVNRQNYKAINFYFKMGFIIEYVADFDIGDGYFMNDFVMVFKRN